MHVLVARVLYELWELRSAISAANAILMYASELMLEEGGEQVMKLSNVFQHFYYSKHPVVCHAFVTSPNFLRISDYICILLRSTLSFFPPFFFFFFELTVQTSVSGSSTQFHGRIIIVPLIVRRNGVLGGEHKRNSFLF